VEKEIPSIETWTSQMSRHEGFFTYYWDQARGKIWLEIPAEQGDFLYVDYLSAGLGSNPVGLDRGRPGGNRIVSFERIGPKVLLVESNLRFRALSEDPLERRAVRDSFAQSVLWGTKVVAESEGRFLVDCTEFLMRDAHGVIQTLKQTKQGSYKLDNSRCAVFLPGTEAFPDNSEFEAVLTFVGEEPGRLVSQMSPDPSAVTLRQHHSFVRLPDDQFQPRRFDPRSGAIAMTFFDYASPIGESLAKQYILRHRLKKKDPSSALSEPIDPIVYYVDPGAPEPIRSALIEGASWWNEAFEAAGFKDAYRVEVLPPNASPLDVRYNVIQWVHRSTRGWSYGSSIIDPRTGEIIKGHVSLGSLRVRQDRLIFEGLQPPYPVGSCQAEYSAAAETLAVLDAAADPVQVALARIRQLSAHEVGHTLGFSHNFSASTFGRASVMDYPAPLVKITEAGELDLSDAYATGIGEWDKVTVRFSYSEYPPESDETQALNAIIQEALADGMYFMSDADARPQGGAHPSAHLWDNGADPVQQLDHVMRVRRIALQRLGSESIQEGAPLASLKAVFVPVYLFHRYQVEATAKLVGGVDYRYSLRGDGQPLQERVPPETQRRALDSLLQALEPAELAIPEGLIPRMVPDPSGSRGLNEQMAGYTGVIFDPQGAAEVAADLVVSMLLHPERAARLAQVNDHGSFLNFADTIEALLLASWYSEENHEAALAANRRAVETVVLDRLIRLAETGEASAEVKATAMQKLIELKDYLSDYIPGQVGRDQRHGDWARSEIERFLDRPFSQPGSRQEIQPPPGSPIGYPN
jgi:hypothetical protein